MLHACEAISLHDPLQQLFAHSLDALRSGTNETAVLAQRVDKQVMVVDAQDSPERVRYTPEIGEFHELHSTAVGKAILGAMPDKLRVALIEALPLERFTHSTIVAGDKLEQELEEGRKRGWHVTRGENILDLCAIAAQVRVGGEIFALCLGGPYHRFITEVDRHAEVLLEVVGALEASQETAQESSKKT